MFKYLSQNTKPIFTQRPNIKPTIKTVCNSRIEYYKIRVKRLQIQSPLEIFITLIKAKIMMCYS